MKYLRLYKIPVTIWPRPRGPVIIGQCIDQLFYLYNIGHLFNYQRIVEQNNTMLQQQRLFYEFIELYFVGRVLQGCN